MAVTIKDVAREAGGSFSTVSKVVNNSHEISEATAIRVREVMKRLDYTPNVRATSFKRRSTRNIAFLNVLQKGAAFVNSHMFEILCGVYCVLARKGYRVTLVDVSGDEKPGDTANAVISSGGYDGIIVTNWSINRSTATMLMRNSFPHIIVGKPAFESQVCWLDTNNTLSGNIAARHAADGGARNIIFIGGSREDGITDKRVDGVRAALEESGIIMNQDSIRYTSSSVEESRAAALELLARKDRPDCVICGNNMVAIGAMKAIHEKGLKLPEDLQLITFDEFPFSRIMDPPPTVVSIDVYDFGEQVASQLLKNIRNPALHVQSYITLPELIIGETTKSRGR
ncbi:MAG: LacI family transcriptional regulator [Oscillospiraceae bacterium]|nr:LacI family transcriptional regulator [Oscillospiraceae bacterium]